MQRSTAHLALTLLIAAGLGVSASSASARGQSTARKPATKKTAQSSKSSANSAHKNPASRSKSKTSKSTKAARRTKGQQAPTTDRITEIQQALAKDGSLTAEPSGKWDDTTAAAVKKFQDAHGLTPTGKLDAHTLQQLGLGSHTAGVAPPMPPVSSSSLTSTTSQANPPVAPQPSPQR